MFDLFTHIFVLHLPVSTPHAVKFVRTIFSFQLSKPAHTVRKAIFWMGYVHFRHVFMQTL
jgi:hypothetical protein